MLSSTLGRASGSSRPSGGCRRRGWRAPRHRLLARCDALLTAPGSPYESLEGALRGIRFARERGVPFAGT
ncbi:MAG: hypothetical protein HY717_13550 [Planctomycetes bacterium]|nr:hypothetical protein [Planctomycetota bacterium]